MKILLTALNAKYIHSSLGIRYLESYCKEAFPNIEIREYNINQSSDYLLGEIYRGDFQVIGFSCYIWNIRATLELVSNLKKVNPNLIIVLGGPEVSFDPVELMEKNQDIDYIVLGEGEASFLDLLHYLDKRKENRENILGLSYRDGAEIKLTGPRPLISDLGQIPFPYKENLADLDNKIIYYESSRGCPYRCSYCLSSTSHGVRFFPLERVKRDLKFFLDAKVKQVKFVDRTFNVKIEHSLAIMQFLNKNDNGYTNFHFELAADLLDEGTLDFLSQVRKGLFQFEIGVQSTNPITLKAINRTMNWEKLQLVVERLASFNNIHLHLDLIAGLPFEDFTSFKKSFNDVYALQTGKIQLGFLKLLKGTSLRDDKEKYGYKFRNSPPYEVLSNNYLNFNEILRLKAMEEMLDLYYNSYGFTYSVKYILANFYQEAADFYEDLSEYWEEEGLHHQAHAKDKLYSFLLDFYSKRNYPNRNVFLEILKFDFLNNNQKALPSYLAQYDQKEFRNILYDFLKDKENTAKIFPEYIGQTAKNILKKVHFELFEYDICEIIENYTNEAIFKSPTVILFDYNQKDAWSFSKLDMRIKE